MAVSRASAAPPPAACVPPPPGPWRVGPRLFTPDGATFVSGSGSSVVLYDTKTWKPRAHLATEKPVASLVVSPDSRWLAVLMKGNTAAGHNTDIVKLATGKRFTSIDTGGHVAFAPDGSWVVFSSPGRGSAAAYIEKLGTPSSHVARTPIHPPSNVEANSADGFRTSKDGKTLAVDWDRSGISLVRAPSGHAVADVTLAHGQFTFSPRDRFFAATTEENTVLVDLAGGRQRALHDRECGGVAQPAFSHDGSRIAIGGNEGVLCVFNTGTGHLLKRYALPVVRNAAITDASHTIKAVGWTAADDGVLAAYIFGGPLLWSVATGRRVHIAGPGAIHSELVRDDGAIVLVTRKGWPVGTITNGPHVVELPEPHLGESASLGASKDAEYVVLGGKKAQVVSTRDGHVRSTFPIATPSTHVSFDAKARFVYPDSGPLRVMDASTGAVVLGRPSCRK